MYYTPSIDFSEPEDDIEIYYEEDDIEIVNESECPRCQGSNCDYCV